MPDPGHPQTATAPRRTGLAMTGQCRPCPPWCADDRNHDLGMHMSARDPVPVPRARGGVLVSACQIDGGPPAPHVLVTASASRGPGASMYLDDPAQARGLAALIDFLACATPEQHRELAAQARGAAAVLDSGSR